ncbi:unnamed protein product [Adineta steineri]|uniref:Bicarbonate transporter-like transmembrane domain-containing protein n=1 Tax=Adineta steineri TaxID=433720 RepID=A0A814AGI1_9BILA|nr:unnamed protein product [Adineta steineri]CAF3485562.1 unnamed protein product [Adineta steineri]
MNDIHEGNTNNSFQQSNGDLVDISITNQTTEDENNIDPKSGYSSHYTSICYPFAGMIRDVKIRLPYYLSDWKLAFSYRIFAATIRIFFLNTIPALAYALDLYLRSEHYYGVNEALLASALGGIVFGLLAVQPISIVGFTGLISLFNYTTYNIISRNSQVPYLSFMCWTAIWAAIFHWLIAIFNLVTYVRYMTNFTAEIFGFYVGAVYIQKGIEFIIDDFHESSTKGFMSVLVVFGFFFSYWVLTHIGQSSYFTRTIRDFFVDYAMILCVIFWSGFAFIPGHLRSTNIERLAVTSAYQPTVSTRSWFVNPSDLDVKYIFIAIPFALLVTALFYFDHNVSSLTAQAKHYPLRKPAGFHWDFFLLGWTTIIAGFLGLPYPNALVPQCAMHTDALGRWKIDECVENQVPTAIVTTHKSRRPVQQYILVKIKEQRLTNTFQSILCLITMFGPFLTCYSLISRAVLAGVFIGIGWGSIEVNAITHRLLHLIRDPNHIKANDPLIRLSRLKIFSYTTIMFIGFLSLFVISQTIAAIGFPVLVLLLIPFRILVLTKWFTPEELTILDSPVASTLPLDSIGGLPDILKPANL